jgi:hypothetical protein
MSGLRAWLQAGLLTLAVTVGSGAAQAGQTCEAGQPRVADLQRGMALAQTTAQRLDASGAQVVLLARAGQDLSAYGLRWSHLGFAYRDADSAGRPVWRVLHKLNGCGSDRAAVWRQGLGEFFMDQPYRYEAAFVVPSTEVQAKVLPLLRDTPRLAAWHTPAYNMLAYPWSQRYQQSNQWVIETLAGAMNEGASDRRRAQAWLQLSGYQPSVLHISAFKRLGARVSRANIAFDDHPNGERFADRIATVTADSVFDWTQRAGLSGPPQSVR